jgi:chromosome segregation ATPase
LRDRLSSFLRGLRRRMLTPVLARLDERLDPVDERLERLARRLDEIEVMLETTAARASTLTEESLGVVESELRLSRRLEEIERLLGAPSPDP